eukprot:766081-Hanusia_phi.AAC.9
MLTSPQDKKDKNLINALKSFEGRDYLLITSMVILMLRMIRLLKSYLHPGALSEAAINNLESKMSGEELRERVGRGRRRWNERVANADE